MGIPQDGSAAANSSPSLTLTLLDRILGGVAVATKAPAHDVDKAKKLFDEAAKNIQPDEKATSESWLSALSKGPPSLPAEDATPFGLARLTIAVASLREHSRRDIPIDEAGLSALWGIVHQVLNLQALQDAWIPSRSAQGFLAVPLCSITQDGNIDELIRLHVWLPDGSRGNPDFFMHSHQPFAQSWILAGQGTDHRYEVQQIDHAANATHAMYGPSWNAGKGPSKTYSTHQQSSVVAPTGKWGIAKKAESNVHRQNDTYTIPAGVFHSSQISPDVLHATLFYFDSSRGFIKDAPVLGPVEGEPYTQLRDPAGQTAKSLAGHVQLIQSWEHHMEEGRGYSRKAEWEHAMRSFNNALSLCDNARALLNVKRYRGLVLGELGNTNRRFGRYAAAEEFLKQACLELQGSAEDASFQGELGVVYRHMDRLHEAQRAFQSQYTIAKQLHLDSEACRAIGNVGMVNYQLSEALKDDSLLTLAIDQLQERVDRCNSMRSSILAGDSESSSAKQRLGQLDVWTGVGLARLSLCWTARKDLDKAAKAAEDSLQLSKNSGDPTVIAISRFLYGRVLAMKGQKEKALRQFNANDGCTSSISFCKEPSDEHRGYLEYLVDVGADMDLVDDQGYKALDYAVFNGDGISTGLVLKGLRRQLGLLEPKVDVDDQLRRRSREAKLRKGYRELFQEKLRSALLSGGDGCIQKLRAAYADALEADKDKSDMFDYFKVVPYKELLRLGRIPRSSDNLFRRFASSKEVEKGQLVIFFSYRWLSPLARPGGGSPDDEKGTQYGRMLQAIDEVLKSHKDIDPEQVQIWLVSEPNFSGMLYLQRVLVGLCLCGPRQPSERCRCASYDPGPVRHCNQSC